MLAFASSRRIYTIFAGVACGNVTNLPSLDLYHRLQLPLRAIFVLSRLSGPACRHAAEQHLAYCFLRCCLAQKRCHATASKEKEPA